MLQHRWRILYAVIVSNVGNLEDVFVCMEGVCGCRATDADEDNRVAHMLRLCVDRKKKMFVLLIY